MLLDKLKNSGKTKLPKNLALLLRETVRKVPNLTLQASKNKSGVFVRYSYSQVYQHIIELASMLKKMGVKKGDNVGIMSDNRREWLIADFALLCLGASDVPRGCDSMGQEMRFILDFSECKVAFFENERQLMKVLEKIDEVPFLTTAILFDHAKESTVKFAQEIGVRVINYSYLESEGSAITKTEWLDIEKGMEEIEPSDTATIIFTSGTTGEPKGVQLTHDNFIAECEAASSVLGLMQKGDIWLSVLPIWHSFERSFCYIVISLEGAFAYSKPIISVMLQDMTLIQPQWMNVVPRLFESVAKGLFREVKKQDRISRLAFDYSVTIGKLYFKAKERVCGLVCHYKSYPRVFDVFAGIIPFVLLWPLRTLSEFLVYKKIRSKFGGKFRAVISGGGALQPETEAFYHAIGFNLLEAYGLTEAAPVISFRNSKKPRSNNVGIVLQSFEVKITEEKDGSPVPGTSLSPGKKGLILVKGRQVMKGYYKRPDLTAKVIDEEGFLNTGDLGMLSYGKELKITGRAKDTIVLLGGENVEPAVIEKAVNESPFVERAVVVGQDKKYLGAIIVPDQANLFAFADENHIVYDNYETLLEAAEIQSLFRSEIDTAVSAEKGFRTCERIFRFVLLPRSFEIGKEINAKQELMRHKIVEIYKKEYKELFK